MSVCPAVHASCHIDRPFNPQWCRLRLLSLLLLRRMLFAGAYLVARYRPSIDNSIVKIVSRSRSPFLVWEKYRRSTKATYRRGSTTSAFSSHRIGKLFVAIGVHGNSSKFRVCIKICDRVRDTERGQEMSRAEIRIINEETYRTFHKEVTHRIFQKKGHFFNKFVQRVFCTISSYHDKIGDKRLKNEHIMKLF